MRLTLRVYLTLIWEDVALEVTVSSVFKKNTCKTYQVKFSYIYHDYLICHRLCPIWTDSPVIGFRLCILWFLFRCLVVEIAVCTNNKVKTAA